jgi:hypothetical protein
VSAIGNDHKIYIGSYAENGGGWGGWQLLSWPSDIFVN